MLKNLFILLLLISINLFGQNTNREQITLFELDGKKGVDSSLTHFMTEAIHNELLMLNNFEVSKNIVWTNDSLNQFSSDLLLKGFIGLVNDAFYIIHLDLVSSSDEIIKSADLNFEGSIEELKIIGIKKIIAKLFGLKAEEKSNEGKLNLVVHDNRNKKRNQIIRRIVSGVFTAGFSAAGVITNMKIQDLEEEYDSSINGSQAYYNRIWQDIDSYNKQRSAFWGAAAGSGVLLLVSISF